MAVINLYRSRGFNVVDIHADMEFERMRHDILPIILNTTAADDHVGDAERSIRTIKERTRATIHGLPYRRVPKLFIKELVEHSVKALNIFPALNGISDTFSPHAIVSGLPNPDYRKLALDFGAYVQVFEDRQPMNTMAARVTGAIALNPTGNAPGDYYFLSLTTRSRLSRHQWTELPITPEVVDALEKLPIQQKQLLI
ncbi:hypothetical protein ACA910_014437 [Epithemia clementina (nom. ined.)]